MEDQIQRLLKSVKFNENTISTVLGGIVLAVIGALIFNYLNTSKVGQITQNAAQTTPTAAKVRTPDDVELVEENGKMIPKDLPTTYKVVKGDDLWHIAEKFYKSGYNWVDIAKENNLANASVIEEGMELTIPKAEAKKATYVATESTIEKKEINIDSSEYTVAKGDNLWTVAVRAYGDGYAWTRIYQANKSVIGTNPGLIEVGMKLVLPR